MTGVTLLFKNLGLGPDVFDPLWNQLFHVTTITVTLEQSIPQNIYEIT